MEKKKTSPTSIQNQVYELDHSKELDFLQAIYGDAAAAAQDKADNEPRKSALATSYTTQQQQQVENKTINANTRASTASTSTEPDVNAIDYWDTMKRLQREHTQREYDLDLAKAKDKRALTERNIDYSLGLGLEASSSGKGNDKANASSPEPSGKDDKVNNVGNGKNVKSGDTKSQASAAESYNESASQRKRLEELQSLYSSESFESRNLSDAEETGETEYFIQRDRSVSTGRGSGDSKTVKAGSASGPNRDTGSTATSTAGSDTSSSPPPRDPAQILEERQKQFFKKWIQEANTYASSKGYKMGGIITSQLAATSYDMDIKNKLAPVESKFIVHKDARNNRLLRVGRGDGLGGSDEVQFLRPSARRFNPLFKNAWTYHGITPQDYVDDIVRSDVFNLVKSFMDNILGSTENLIPCTASFKTDPMWFWSDGRLRDPKIGISIDKVLLGNPKTMGNFTSVPENVIIRVDESSQYILNHRRVQDMCKDIAQNGFTVLQWIEYSYALKLLSAFQDKAGFLDIQPRQIDSYKSKGYFVSGNLQRRVGIFKINIPKNAHLNDSVEAPRTIVVENPDTELAEEKTVAEVKAMLASTTSTGSASPLSSSSTPAPSSGQAASETSSASSLGSRIYNAFNLFGGSARGNANSGTSSSLGESKGLESDRERRDEESRDQKEETKRRDNQDDSASTETAAERRRKSDDVRKAREDAAATLKAQEDAETERINAKARAQTDTETKSRSDAETARKAKEAADVLKAQQDPKARDQAAQNEAARIADEKTETKTEEKKENKKQAKKSKKDEAEEFLVIPSDTTRVNFVLTNPPTMPDADRALVQQASEEWMEAKTLEESTGAIAARARVLDVLYKSYLTSIVNHQLWNPDSKKKVVQAQGYFSIVPLGKRGSKSPAFEEIWNTTAPTNLTKELPYHLTGKSPDPNVPSAKASVFNTIETLILNRIKNNTKWIEHDAKEQFGDYAVFYTSPFICVFLSWCKQYVDILQQEIYPRTDAKNFKRYFDPNTLFQSIERALFYTFDGLSDAQLKKMTCNSYYQRLAAAFNMGPMYQTIAKPKYTTIVESVFVGEKLESDLVDYSAASTVELRFAVTTLMKAVQACMEFKRRPDQDFELVSNGADLVLDLGRFASSAAVNTDQVPQGGENKQGYYGRRQFQIEASSAADSYQRVTRGRLDMLAPKAGQDASLLLSWLQSGVSVHFIDRTMSKKAQGSGFQTPGHVLLYLLGDLQVSVQVAKSGRVVDVDLKDITRIGTVVSESNTVAIESPNSVVAKISDFQDRDELFELYFIHKMPILLVRMVDRTPGIASAESIGDEDIDESQDQSYDKALEEIGYKGSALRNKQVELLGPGGRGQDLREWRRSFQEWWARERETNLLNHYEYMNVYHDRTGSQERPNLFLHPEQFKLLQEDLQSLREQFATTVQRIFEVTTFDAETNKRLIEAQAELAIIQRSDGPLLERDPNRLHYMVSHLQNDGQYVRVLLPGITGHVLARVTGPYNAQERTVGVAIEGPDPNDASDFGNLFFAPEQRQDLGNLNVSVAQISEWLPQPWYADLGIGAERRLSPFHENALIDDLSALSPVRKTIARTCLNRVWNSTENKQWATRDKTLWDPLVSMLLQIVPGSLVDFVWFGDDENKTVIQGVLLNLNPDESDGAPLFYSLADRYFRVRITSINGSTVASRESDSESSDLAIGMEKLVPIVNIVGWRHAFQNHMDQFVAKAFRAQLYLFLLKIDAQETQVKIANLSNFDDYELARGVTHLSIVPRL